MSIVLTRVDFRLIHGQVITQWVTRLQVNEIVTIDTQLSTDDFMQDVFKMAAPKGVKITITSVDGAIVAQERGDFDQKNTMLLFKSVQELDKAVRAGLKLSEVQIGGLGGGPGRKAVHNAITLDQTDADVLKALSRDMHVNIVFQTTPDYSAESLDKVITRL